MNPKEKIISFIKDKHDAIVQSNGEWYKMKCPFCGDSPNPHTTHFNIRISEDDNFMVKKCFQPGCVASGLLTRDGLIHIGISDTDVLRFVIDSAKENKDVVSRISGTKLNLEFPDLLDEPKEYIYRRTNIDLDKEDNIKKYRIVTDLNKFYNINKDKIEYNKRLWMLMAKERKGKRYVGFVNDTGTFMDIRSVKDGKITHMKIPLKEFPLYVDHKPYLIKHNFSLKRKMKIYIGEGVFDIINVYNFFRNDGVYIRTGSINSYYKIFKRFSKYYYDVEWVFIRDKDVSIEFFKKLKKTYSYRIKHDPLIIYNDLSKDFGDLREPIEVKKIKI